ncbi:hypothetical protein GCM10011611_31040 [Aliidongia dinghuensis]|uniref:Uncharacterized protein n=1 Tax=Aliidongia dinghuensis TaxID=1867774 RepID=A0A8J3E4B5_9PROT|nr:hypothetical protein GCM10011611_31040 [Aliidongia dinghuensis]
MSPYDPAIPEADAQPRAAAASVRGWLLDRRIPVAAVVSLSLQILVAGLWFGRTEARLDMLDAWVRESLRHEIRACSSAMWNGFPVDRRRECRWPGHRHYT